MIQGGLLQLQCFQVSKNIQHRHKISSEGENGRHRGNRGFITQFYLYISSTRAYIDIYTFTSQIKATPHYWREIPSVSPSLQQSGITKTANKAVRLEIICCYAFSSHMTSLPASDSSLHLWHSQTALLEYWGSGENAQVRHRQDMALRMEMNIKFSSVLYKIPS